MFLKDVEHRLNARPFEPFVMNLTSGERIIVRPPENVYKGKNSIFVVYARNQELQGFSNVSLYHIAKIERLNGEPQNGRAKRRTRKKKAGILAS